MTGLPENVDLLGTTAHPLRVTGASAQIEVTIAAAPAHRLFSEWTDGAEHETPRRVYVVLEGIRGTCDAALLSVYLNLREGVRSPESNVLLAGSESLYGLRRATNPGSSGHGQGLSAIMDATEVIKYLLASRSLDTGKIAVTIVLDRRLPEGVEIMIGCIAFFLTS